MKEAKFIELLYARHVTSLKSVGDKAVKTLPHYNLPYYFATEEKLAEYNMINMLYLKFI